MVSLKAHNLAPDPAVTLVCIKVNTEPEVPPVIVPVGTPAGSVGLLYTNNLFLTVSWETTINDLLFDDVITSPTENTVPVVIVS